MCLQVPSPALLDVSIADKIFMQPGKEREKNCKKNQFETYKINVRSGNAHKYQITAIIKVFSGAIYSETIIIFHPCLQSLPQ